MAFLVEVSPEQSGREGDMNVVQRSMLAMLLLASAAHADRQAIAPGTGLQSAVEVDSGPNGICQTRAPGDDRQLIPVGNACPGAGAIVVDTGPDGIANSTVAGDDVQLIPVGSAAPHTPCVLTGGNGLADTPDPAGGD